MRNDVTKMVAGVLLIALTGCQGEDLRNGYVKLVLEREVSPTPVPASETKTVSATLRYGDCLAAYYDSNPSLRQDGTSGAGDFDDGHGGGEGWKDRLCDGTIDGTFACEVQSIEQSSNQLTVTYGVDTIVDNATLAFGPVPLPETAKCSGGDLATVHVVSTSGVHGLDASGATIWQAATYEPAEVVAGPTSKIKVKRGPP